ncbi:hypothetical protein L3X38_017253 [Prunus dulcis]|uniref:Uncharacterized protein n=1 Tax=Prunus dulcis TaxID=3755 RepID=A0AAD4W9F4_PRUDU|nr:hypothetical protein L3X38_017253 [Prunus dulcis]
MKDTNFFDHVWKKRSIFFELPYWKNLLLRHNLDVMHVEKNICESIIGTLLLMKGKAKDGIKSRKDLENMGIRKYLHPKKRGKHFYLSAAPHTLSKKEKETFCWRLANLKLPDGYGSNIGNCISLEDSKIFGLKSHDYHMLMQQLLLVALRGLLPKGPRAAIFRLCAFFNELCQRVVDRNKLEKLEEDIVHTFCMIESKYIKQAADIGSRNARNEEFENGLLLEGRPISQGKRIILTNEMLQVAHRQVLFSMAEMSHI